MTSYIPVINAFIEDTCVLMVIAYLLARGRLLAFLSQSPAERRRPLLPGLLLGMVGLTEVIFPGARAPYVTHTLCITFATLLGGLRAGLVAAATVLLGVAVLGTTPGVLETALILIASALVAGAVRHLFGERLSLLRGLTAGASAQASVLMLYQVPVRIQLPSYTLAHGLASVLANGFGVMLLQFILNDARTRADSERHRLEARRAQALVAEAQLTALRARVHPHFLFNALNSIAALYGLAPDKAQTATLRLSQLMRRALETSQDTPVSFAEELAFVRDYLEIEQYRLGDRLKISWEIDPAACDTLVPAFALQTLVENAVSHGVTPKMEPGQLRIVARLAARWTLIAVRDDGVGIDRQACAEARCSGVEPQHGLQIVTQQLALLYGSAARLRLFSRPDAGTLVAFAVPNGSAGRMERKNDVDRACRRR
jgi:LytS/YehU family sensor histidine kinase